MISVYSQLREYTSQQRLIISCSVYMSTGFTRWFWPFSGLYAIPFTGLFRKFFLPCCDLEKSGAKNMPTLHVKT